jgi:DNA-binding winged helix-turn-helix (wHTH) protein/TolB-like protein
VEAAGLGEAQQIDLAREPAFRLGRLEVSPPTRQVAWDGQSRTLEPRVMQALVALAGAQDRVVGRDELIDRCWDGRVVGDNAVNRVMSVLRRLAEETNAFSLTTVTKVGYRLAAEGGERLAVDPGATPRPRRLGPAVLAASLAAAAVVAAGVWWLAARGPSLGEAQNGRVELTRFETRGADPELGRLSDELGEAFTRVFTRASIDAARAGDGAAGGQPAELKMTGSVDRDGERVVVNAQLADRRTGVVLSSLQVVRPAQAVAGLADQTALSVAAGLSCALEDRKRSRRRMAPEVFALYLNTCDAVAREGNPQRMLATARKLVDAAPRLAVAHALYGIAQANAAEDVTVPADAEALRRGARDSAALALRLDPATPKAYIAIANSYPAGAWLAREQNYLSARRIDPNLTPGRISYIAMLRQVGRLAEARALTQEVIDGGDPRTLSFAPVHAIFIDAALGDLDGARSTLEALQRSDPETAAGMGWMLASTFEPPEPALARLHALPSSQRSRTFGCVETFLRELPARAARHARGLPEACAGAPPERRVQMLAREGDLDGAFAEAEPALRAPRVFLGFLFYPAMKDFRADPRFIPLARRLGLADYWRRSGHWPDFCAEPGLAYDCRTAFGAGARS